MTSTLPALVTFLETGELPPGVFAPDAVADFNVPSWRFAINGPAAIAEQRRDAGPGSWSVVVERVEPTETGYVVELTHEHGGEFYRTLTLVTEADGMIAGFVHYCTGNWDAATRRAYAES